MKLFKNPSLATIHGWNFYKDYQERAHNRCFNYTIFTDLQDWWAWVWKGYYEEFDWQTKDL